MLIKSFSIHLREMGDLMRKMDAYFDNVTIAANYTEQQNGSFALIYDMPSVQYWKGEQNSPYRLVMYTRAFHEHWRTRDF